jgi:hypothetical protein
MPAGRAGIKRLSGRYRFKDRLWELNCGILGLGLSVGAAFTITGALKNAIGKPRPDLIDRYAVRYSRPLCVYLHTTDARSDRASPVIPPTGL